MSVADLWPVGYSNFSVASFVPGIEDDPVTLTDNS